MFNFLALAFLALAILPANAQSFPTGPVKVISDAAAGSPPDAILRLVGDRLSRIWAQPLVVMNMPGAGGSIAIRAASSAPADGMTLLFASASLFVTMKGSAPNIPIEVPRDFAPISLVGHQPMFVTVAPDAGFRTLADLISAARSRPGEITYAVSGRGRQGHLTGEMLNAKTGIKLVMIPYSGGPAQAMGDVFSGRVQMLIDGGASLLGPIRAGKLNVLAVGSASRLSEFADVPTMAETVPDLVSVGWFVFLAPPATPAALVRKLSEDVRMALTDPELREKLANAGNYAQPMSPSQTLEFIRNEQSKWMPVLNELMQTQTP